MGFFQSIYNSDLPSRAVAVYIYLSDHTNPQSQCFPAINTIAGALGLSRSTVKRALHDLEDNGWITRVQRYRENGSKSSLLFTIRR